uniref:Uncharacterized protein n=1 Tax=Timema poppense TaxID=170557 RepID=A0A7R9DMF8_TIMPO|nr:unnamed protein product [Timema poppensis]
MWSIGEKKKDCKSNVVSRPLTPDMFEEDFPSVPETMNYPDVALQIEGLASFKVWHRSRFGIVIVGYSELGLIRLHQQCLTKKQFLTSSG